MQVEILERAPRGIFKGKNFMTPYVARYFATTYRGARVFVELSSGNSIFDRYRQIWGVTIKLGQGGQDATDDAGKSLSKCCATKGEALEYIESLATL